MYIFTVPFELIQSQGNHSVQSNSFDKVRPIVSIVEIELLEKSNGNMAQPLINSIIIKSVIYINTSLLIGIDISSF